MQKAKMIFAGLAIAFAGAAPAATTTNALDLARAVKAHMRAVVREASAPINFESQTNSIVTAYNTYGANWVAVSGMKFQPVLAVHNGGAAAAATCGKELNRYVETTEHGQPVVTDERALLDAAAGCLVSLQELSDNSGLSMTSGRKGEQDALAVRINQNRQELGQKSTVALKF
jgi:hypothetical protein